MEHAFDILINGARGVIAVIGYGCATAALTLAIYGLTHDYKARFVDKETAGGVALLLIVSFVLAIVTSIALRVTA